MTHDPLPQSIAMTSMVDTASIIESVCESLTYNELLAFIVQLDEAVADWDFTKELHRHFANQMALLDEEDKTIAQEEGWIP